MSSSKLTVLGLYRYDNTLFDEIVLPAGITKDVLVNNILLKSADFECLYPNPTFLKSVINLFFLKNNRTFNKWVNALSIEYKPLENYNRVESWSDITSTDNSTNVAGNSSSTSTANDSNTSASYVSAYDTSEYQNSGKDESANESKTTAQVNDSSTSDSSSNTTNTRKGTTSGNIGVTTSQQMLQAELDISAWNIYEHITDLFLAEVCIPIY